MGKFEGMDPKLVRDLLSEVQQAAVRMRTAEDRVNHLMRGAGLPALSTHHPAQIADDCEKMVRDVSTRVELLEKKVKQEAGAPPGAPKAGDAGSDSPKTETGSQGGDDKPRVGDQSAETVPRDDPKDQPRADAPKGDDAKPETGSKGDDAKSESRVPRTSPRRTPPRATTRNPRPVPRATSPLHGMTRRSPPEPIRETTRRRLLKPTIPRISPVGRPQGRRRETRDGFQGRVLSTGRCEGVPSNRSAG